MAEVALALRVLPHPMRRSAGLSLGPSTPRTPLRAAASADQIVRAIHGAGRVIPGGGNCLVRALAARAVLARHGQSSELMLGVARRPPGGLRGHAWLRCGGSIVIGQYGADAYAPMPGLARSNPDYS